MGLKVCIYENFKCLHVLLSYQISIFLENRYSSKLRVLIYHILSDLINNANLVKTNLLGDIDVSYVSSPVGCLTLCLNIVAIPYKEQGYCPLHQSLDPAWH